MGDCAGARCICHRGRISQSVKHPFHPITDKNAADLWLQQEEIHHAYP